MLKIINLGVMGSLRILRRSFRFFFSKKASFSYKDNLSELTPVQSFSRGLYLASIIDAAVDGTPVM